MEFLRLKIAAPKTDDDDDAPKFTHVLLQTVTIQESIINNIQWLYQTIIIAT